MIIKGWIFIHNGPKIKYCLFALDLPTHKNWPYQNIVYLPLTYLHTKPGPTQNIVYLPLTYLPTKTGPM